MGSGRQHDVGVTRGIGHELLVHDGEQVLALQAFDNQILIGQGHHRIQVVDHEPGDGRCHAGVGQHPPELREVHAARRFRQGRRCENRAVVETLVEQIAGEMTDTAAEIPPRAGQGRQTGDCTKTETAVGVALHADHEAQRRRPRSGIESREFFDVGRGEACDVGDTLRRVVLDPLT